MLHYPSTSCRALSRSVLKKYQRWQALQSRHQTAPHFPSTSCRALNRSVLKKYQCLSDGFHLWVRRKTKRCNSSTKHYLSSVLPKSRDREIERQKSDRDTERTDKEIEGVKRERMENERESGKR